MYDLFSLQDLSKTFTYSSWVTLSNSRRYLVKVTFPSRLQYCTLFPGPYPGEGRGDPRVPERPSNSPNTRNMYIKFLNLGQNPSWSRHTFTHHWLLGNPSIYGLGTALKFPNV